MRSIAHGDETTAPFDVFSLSFSSFLYPGAQPKDFNGFQSKMKQIRRFWA